MTATNHVVTGVLIATVVTNPLIGLPLVLISHLFLDILPHFGVEPENLKVFLPVLLIDMTLAGSILLWLLIAQPSNHWYLIAAGIVAASPDLLSIPRFISILKHRQHSFGRLQRFLSRIQWSQTVPGIVIEALWFTAAGWYIVQRIVIDIV